MLLTTKGDTKLSTKGSLIPFMSWGQMSTMGSLTPISVLCDTGGMQSLTEADTGKHVLLHSVSDCVLSPLHRLDLDTS